MAELVQVIHRDIKETLDLWRVQIHCHNTVGTRSG